MKQEQSQSANFHATKFPDDISSISSISETESDSWNGFSERNKSARVLKRVIPDGWHMIYFNP